MLSLKGKLRRIDSGMSKEEFALSVTRNMQGTFMSNSSRLNMFDPDGNLKPANRWSYFLWRDVRTLRATTFVVRPEYVEEVIGYLCMVGVVLKIKTNEITSFWRAMHAIGLKAERAIAYVEAGSSDHIYCSSVNFTVSISSIMAVETDKCWLVCPSNIRRVNRLLSRKERRND